MVAEGAARAPRAVRGSAGLGTARFGLGLSRSCGTSAPLLSHRCPASLLGCPRGKVYVVIKALLIAALSPILHQYPTLHYIMFY